MAGDIDFRAKTDRELLILTAATVNGCSADLKLANEHLAKINGTLEAHEKRIDENATAIKKNAEKLGFNWQKASIIALVIAIVIFQVGGMVGIW